MKLSLTIWGLCCIVRHEVLHASSSFPWQLITIIACTLNLGLVSIPFYAIPIFPLKFQFFNLLVYIYMSSSNEAFLVPAGPCATGKRVAGSMMSDYLDELRTEPRYVLSKLCVTSKPWLLYGVS